MMHLEENTRAQYSRIKVILGEAKLPRDVPHAHGKIKNMSRWSSAIMFWIFNRMVNRGVESLFNYNGALWLKDVKKIDLGEQGKGVLDQVFDNKGQGIFVLGISPEKAYSFGFSTTRLSRQVVPMEDHWPEYITQVEMLNLIWTAKISWLQLHFGHGECFRVITGSLLDFAEALETFKLNTINAADNMNEFGRALKEASEAVNGKS